MSWKIHEHVFEVAFTAQKMKVSIKYFFNNCNQIRRKLRIWSHLLVTFTEEILKGKLQFLRRLSYFLDILEVYLEPCQTSKMKFFVTIVNGFQP